MQETLRGQLTKARGVGKRTGTQGDDATGGSRRELGALIVPKQGRSEEGNEDVARGAASDEFKEVPGGHLGGTQRIHLKPLHCGNRHSGPRDFTSECGEDLVRGGLGERAGVAGQHREPASGAEMPDGFVGEGASDLLLHLRVPSWARSDEGPCQGGQGSEQDQSGDDSDGGGVLHGIAGRGEGRRPQNTPRGLEKTTLVSPLASAALI